MASTWTYASDDVVLKLPADLPEDGALQPVHYETTWEAFRHALALYGRYFPTFAAIFLVPLLVGESIAWAARLNRWTGVDLAIRFIAVFIAFAPLVHAVSDVCIGNRPRVRRSYRRAGWRAMFRVTGACTLATLIIVAPALIFFVIIGVVGMVMDRLTENSGAYLSLLLLGVAGFGVGTYICLRTIVRIVFVPVIIVVEPRVPLRRIFRRSRLLGAGFAARTIGVILAIALILLLALLLHDGLQSLGPRGEMLGILLARLLWPIPSIAVTLIYYDLRARKEGYGIAEHAESLD